MPLKAARNGSPKNEGDLEERDRLPRKQEWRRSLRAARLTVLIRDRGATAAWAAPGTDDSTSSNIERQRPRKLHEDDDDDFARGGRAGSVSAQQGDGGTSARLERDEARLQRIRTLPYRQQPCPQRRSMRLG
ncbi:hypothetical protein HPB50_000396 [Hyalomma asiaticum]|uniref:Uncharacterized protein n=1 Tax=Hyalomma asiaticum TaxID=266040 RepID=A0ACB7SAA6_HYAAI|nr:hypothetical protein HPB50_000396 [Hyalomma asiaticum]